jgi:FAD/FMN-containing dehydrogenase
VEEIFRAKDRPFRTLALRGAGRSYGDASLNGGGAVLDLRGLRAIRSFDPSTGRVRVEPGVTVEELWQRVLPEGFWPPVVPGTMYATVGGAVSMNIHGKNCFAAGPIGDHVESVSLVLPTGERVECGPDRRADLFEAVIGGFGMLGCITEVGLRLKRVHSGLLRVRAFPIASLAEAASVVEEHARDASYLVGWCDALAPGDAIGRGVIHRADYLAEGEDPEASETLRVERQHLPGRLLGVVPRDRAWRLMAPFLNRAGMRMVNLAKALGHRLEGSGAYFQSHAAFHFLLDYVPGWVRSYGRSGLIQVQPFLPKDGATDAMIDILRLARRRGLPPYLVVFKKHRRDRFLLSHGLDGYSLAMDFPARRRAELWSLAREIQRIALDAGGRFYLAKDSTLTPEHLRRCYPEGSLRAFRELKKKCDPEGLLQTDLARRVWPDLFDAR